MKTIWKFPLLVNDLQLVAMPKGAEILTVQVQNGWPCLWAVIDDAKPKMPRTVEIFGTGDPIHQGMGVSRKYIGTVQLDGLVWHIFEREN